MIEETTVPVKREMKRMPIIIQRKVMVRPAMESFSESPYPMHVMFTAVNQRALAKRFTGSPSTKCPFSWRPSKWTRIRLITSIARNMISMMKKTPLWIRCFMMFSMVLVMELKPITAAPWLKT